jgi:hypothetical protein
MLVVKLKGFQIIYDLLNLFCCIVTRTNLIVAATKFVAAAEFAEAAKFVVAACIDKEGNADVGDVFPTAQVVTRGYVDVAIVVVDNGDAIAVAVAARVHAVLVALAVAVCGSKGDSTGDSRMVALQRTGRRRSG